MRVTSSGDSCHVRERSLFHREKSAKTARIDPAAANPSIARPCEPTICIGSEIQQLSRQHTLKPGQRDAFIALFDRHFVESQEAVGVRLPVRRSCRGSRGGRFHSCDTKACRST